MSCPSRILPGFELGSLRSCVVGQCSYFPKHDSKCGSPWKGHKFPLFPIVCIFIFPIIFIFLFQKLGPWHYRFLKPHQPNLCTWNLAEGFRIMKPKTSTGLRFVEHIPSYQSQFTFLFPFSPNKISLNVSDPLQNSFRVKKSSHHENGYGLKDKFCEHKVPC